MLLASIMMIRRKMIRLTDLLPLLLHMTIASSIVAAAAGTNVGSNTNSNGLQCQRIAVPECQGLGYNMTSMPNLAGHTQQLEAKLRIAKLMPLIESGCSDRARFLLCFSLFPLCSPDVPRPVAPCKSLCETVKTECAAQTELMQLWPEFLDCEDLPQPAKQELCMQMPEQYQQKNINQPPAESVDPPQHPLLQHAQKQATNNMAQQPQKHKGPSTHAYWSWSMWNMPVHLGPKTNAATIICPQNFTANPLNSNECVPQCHRDGFHSTQQKKVAESLILGLSAVCFVLTLFSLVTFWAEPTRFGYPERPVLFLCLCYNLFSVFYLERIVFHNSSRALAMMEDPLTHKLSVGAACSLTPPCLASYITTSYLSLCAATWWLIFAICFYLSSHQKWSSEALEKKSGLFHVLAWVPPLAPPIAALLMEKVRPSELTGMCSAPGFVEIPAIVLLILGLVFTLRASRSLHSLQQQMQPTLGHQRFSQIRKRFLIFSLLFFLPTLLGVLATFFERNEGALDTVPACSTHEDCAPPPQVTAWPSLIRIFFQLAGGTLTGMWVWSRKTCESYRSRLIHTTPPNSSANSTVTSKTLYALPKKQLYASGKSVNGAPLYSGINFHNVPVYSSNQLHV